MAILRWNAPVRFWSPGDERAFFTWLESIGGVTRIEGKGESLLIHLRSKGLSKTALCELVAIYKRYVGDVSEITSFRDSK